MMSTSPIAPLTFAALVAGAMLGAGCHRGARPGAAPAPAAGTERGACRPDRSCDRGLTCLSELCVRPPAADCAKVGEAMSYLLLDNYAPRDERDALRAAIAKQCADESLSADDGACLVRARSRADLRACPHLVGLGDCAKITAHLDGLRATGGVDAYLVTGADRVIARCKNETPTLAFERCVMATHTVDDVDRCVW
ncbi:MAG TPA: hypothetical protein VHE35_36790 [Kofleriaceae bacterium]|nr:hypothetical protein [Kofleriaceae bacterium]